MSELKSGIYVAVASPPQVLWAPAQLAAISFVTSMALGVFVMNALGLSILFMIFFMIVGHGAAIALGARDQHVYHVIVSMGKYGSRKKNFVPVSQGTKYVP